MSVYTEVTQQQLAEFLSHYSIGELVDYAGITDGIENTNYFVTTTLGSFVLTIFESLQKDLLPYYVELMAFFNERNIPSAHPIADNNNGYLRSLNDKPAIVMQRLSGTAELSPQLQHCEVIGATLARLHIMGLFFPNRQADSRGKQWRIQTGELLLGKLSGTDAEILKSEIELSRSVDYSSLPRGVIHADLFRDNALFQGDQLTGILDFYNACNECFLYDLAITVNDWCTDDNGELNMIRASKLCQAYHSVRNVSDQEIAQWPTMLRIAALRFWLSRLWSQFHPVPGMMTFLKDPDEFRHIIVARTREMSLLNDVWQRHK